MPYDLNEYAGPHDDIPLPGVSQTDVRRGMSAGLAAIFFAAAVVLFGLWVAL